MSNPPGPGSTLTSEHRPMVLASQSPSRRQLLRAAGVNPVVIVSEVDESEVAARLHAAHPAGRLPTGELALALAEAKAVDVANRVRAGGFGDADVAMDWNPAAAVIVAADSLADVDGVTMGKATGPADAIARVTALSAGSLYLHTGHCVIDLATGRQRSAVRATRVDFAAVSEAEVRAYVASGEPVGVAGCFTLEGYAAPFIEGIDGDPSNVMGLSLPLLRRLLNELDVQWLQIVNCML